MNFTAKDAKVAKGGREDLEAIGAQVVDSLLEVHKQLGPGLLESAYELAFCHELASRHIPFERQKPVAVVYKSVQLDAGFRIDVLVANEILVELKSVEGLLPVHEAQLLTYLRLSNRRLGFLVNMNVSLLKHGLKRLVHNL